MIHLIIPGYCQPNQSSENAVFVVKGKRIGGQKTPDKTRVHREYVKLLATSYMNKTGKKCLNSGTVEVRVIVYRASLASGSNALKAARRAGTVRPSTRPDLDNQIKLMFDSLNGICYGDDAQICQMEVEKRFDDGNGERTEITIRQWIYSDEKEHSIEPYHGGGNDEPI